MEDVTKITKKVVIPKTTVKEMPKEDDGMVDVEYTRKSEKYPLKTRLSRPLAEILAKRGILIIKN